MNEACTILLQHTNFQSFSKARANVTHFNCRIDFAYWERINDDSLTFHIRANRFLWGMVRTIVGTMIEIGQERMSLNSLNRLYCPVTGTGPGGQHRPMDCIWLRLGYPAAVLSAPSINQRRNRR